MRRSQHTIELLERVMRRHKGNSVIPYLESTILSRPVVIEIYFRVYLGSLDTRISSFAPGRSLFFFLN